MSHFMANAKLFLVVYLMFPSSPTLRKTGRKSGFKRDICIAFNHTFYQNALHLITLFTRALCGILVAPENCELIIIGFIDE